MRAFDRTARIWLVGEELDPAWLRLSRFVLVCKAADMNALQRAFSFDDDTVRDCTDLDESVRLASYDGYDFISLVNIEAHDACVITSELNLYLSGHYLILVMPDASTNRIDSLVNRFQADITQLHGPEEAYLSRALGTLLHLLLQDSSETLECLEDSLEALQDRVICRVDKRHLAEITKLHKHCYAAKKHMRAMADIGDQLLVNSNGFLLKSEMRIFQSIGGRLQRLGDYASSLYELSNQLQGTFDSKMQGKTNDAVNKLTIVTVFFGPLTVITGIYGMNFTHMPELDWWFGYPLALLAMVLITLIIYRFFKKSEWL